MRPLPNKICVLCSSLPMLAALLIAALLNVALPIVATAQDDESNPAHAADLAAPVRIHAGDQPISVPGFAAPFFADMNSDGVKDLLVGQLDHGRMRIYPNHGTDEAPRFMEYEWFEAGGEVVSVPTGCAVGFTPHVIDYDDDGHLDVLTGSFYGGVVFLFRGIGDGRFDNPTALQNHLGSVQLQSSRPGLQYNSTAFVRDWDHDGDHDLILGRGQYQLVENIGTAQAPKYDVARRIARDGEELDGGYVAPVVADWDGDGRDDLICGLGRDVVWYQGIGMSEKPEFAQPEVLINGDHLGSHQDDEPDAEREAPSRQLYSICVTDFNGDGRLDLLVGDHYYVTRDLDEDEEAVYLEAQTIRSEFWAEYREVVQSIDEGEAPSSQTSRLDDALMNWQTLTQVPWVGVQASGRRMQRFGGVWYYERKSEDDR